MNNLECLVCDTKAGNYFNQLEGVYKIIKCSNCGLEYTNPIPNEEELKKFYSTYSDVRAETEVVELNAKNNISKLKNYGLTENSKILDFGAGKGIFVDVAGENCYGVDYIKSSNTRIKLNLEDNFDGIISWDFITLWGVFEHLQYPKLLLKNLSKILKVNGFIAITTVDAEGIIPYFYKPPEHLTYWTKKSFDLLDSYRTL
mgnify:CR=1 FL=1